MKISVAFCDLHPSYALRASPITISFGHMGKPAVIEALRCTRPMCDRHYTGEYGYFDSPEGAKMDFGEIDKKRRCGLSHEVRCLVVTKVEGDLVWACPWFGQMDAGPNLDCKTTQPFDVAK